MPAGVGVEGSSSSLLLRLLVALGLQRLSKLRLLASLVCLCRRQGGGGKGEGEGGRWKRAQFESDSLLNNVQQWCLLLRLQLSVCRLLRAVLCLSAFAMEPALPCSREDAAQAATAAAPSPSPSPSSPSLPSAASATATLPSTSAEHDLEQCLDAIMQLEQARARAHHSPQHPPFESPQATASMSQFLAAQR